MYWRWIFTTIVVAGLGWTLEAQAQDFKPPRFNDERPFAAPAGGNQALFVDDFGVIESEPNPNVFVGIVTDVVMKADTEYVIEAAVGNANGETLADQSIQLWSTTDEIGSDGYGHMTQAFTGFAPSWENTPEEGQWATNRTSYITPIEEDQFCVEADSAIHPNHGGPCVGEKVAILLSNYAWPPGGEVTGRVFYDNVRVLEDGVEVWKEDFEGTPTPLGPGEVVSPEVLGWHRMISPGRNGPNAEEEAGLIVDGKYGIFGGVGTGAPTGDFDGNGLLNAADINALTTEVQAGTNNPVFDLNGDTLVNADDRRVWVIEKKVTWFGDADFDMLFNSSDLLEVFSVGKYANGEAALWQEGDWDGNGVFDSDDLLEAFSDGGYLMGRRDEAAAVPEPMSFSALWLPVLWLTVRRRKTVRRTS